MYSEQIAIEEIEMYQMDILDMQGDNLADLKEDIENQNSEQEIN